MYGQTVTITTTTQKDGRELRIPQTTTIYGETMADLKAARSAVASSSTGGTGKIAIDYGPVWQE